MAGTAKHRSKRLVSHSIKTSLDDTDDLLPLESRDSKVKVAIGFCRWSVMFAWMQTPSRRLF